MNDTTLRRRYFYKLFASINGAIIGLVIQMIVPRGLGPKAYGDFTFLSSFFTELVSFFDMGTSTGFYTKLSQRQRESSLVVFYLFYFTTSIIILIISFVAIANSTSLNIRLWPGQTTGYIYMGCIFGILTWIGQTFTKIADAYGLTTSTEVARAIQRILGLLLIVALFCFKYLNLKTFFYYHYFILCFLFIAMICIILRASAKANYSFNLSCLSKEQIVQYIKEFYQYNHPLFVYALFVLVGRVFDRWLLQISAGSVQQGYFGLSYQIGAFCFLFSGAMSPLLMREFSIAYGNKDIITMKKLFYRYIPPLYSVIVFFSCFIAAQSDKVVKIFGGNKYAGAVTVVTIMAFYPIHQTYGQLSGSVFFATGQTALYRNIGIASLALGLPLTYFLIAPIDKMGFNAGATGLAIKMVSLQFIAVNVQLYFNAKFLNMSFWRFIKHQISCIAFFLGVAVVATMIVDHILEGKGNVVLNLLLAGILYTLIVVISAYRVPYIIGANHQDVKSLLNMFLSKIKK